MAAINITREKDFVIIEIDNGKVNAISTDLSRALKEAFLTLDKDPEVRGVLLTGRENVFSAGLDVMELANADIDGLRVFWREYLLALQAMVRFSKPFVCAITGYAPAGATIFTLCADYRIMAKGQKHVIGMHEFNMSMQIPELLCDIFVYYLGEAKAWKSVQLAKLYNSDEAKVIGLVDESLSVEEVIPKAKAHLKRELVVFDSVYKQSKKYFRKGLLKIVDRDIDSLVEDIIDFNTSDPKLMAFMERFLGQLKKK